MSNGSIVFDRAAEYYDETRGFPPGVEQQIGQLMRDAGNLSGTSRVVEVGVGTGRIALPLAPHVGAYYGIDLSRPMLDKLHAKQTTEPIHVVQGDITQLPFVSAGFDAAVAVHIFHLVPGWRTAFEELARVLRRGAPLLYAGNFGDGDDVFSPLMKAFESALPEGAKDNPGVPSNKANEAPVEAGWKSVGPEHKLEFTRTRTPRKFLNRLEGRTWSRMWKLTDEEFALGMQAVHRLAEAMFSDLDQTIVAHDGFRVQLYLPPDRETT